jgi:hypothetical protein
MKDFMYICPRKEMVKWVKISCALLVGVCFTGCKKDPPPLLALSPNVVTISSNGDQMTIDLKSNVSWKITSVIPNWLIINPTSGNGNAQIHVHGVPNTMYNRTSIIQITGAEIGSNVSATLHVTQHLISFNFDLSNILLGADGKVVQVALNTEAEWSVEGCPDWSEITPKSGAGNSKINVSASTNANKKERTGTISFKYYDQTISLPLSQQGNPAYNQPPDAPELLFPSNHATNVSTYPNFEWRCSDPDGDPLTYNVSVSVNGIDFTEYGPFDNTKVYLDVELKPSTTYHYRIKANDGDNGITYSDTYSFTTLHRSVYADGEVISYIESLKPKPVVLVFTGDGYVAQDCNVGGLFEQNASEGIEALFSVEPYKTYRDFFSVYIVIAHSLESGATQKDIGSYKMTAFGSTFEGTGTSMTTNTDKAFDYARKVPVMADYGINNTCVLMMVNQDRYAGTCWMWGNGRSVAICPVSKRSGTTGFASIVLHEAGGHGFGRLADEYVTSNGRIPDSEVLSNRAGQSAGMYLNVDFTSDPQKILWSHFLGLPGYNRVDIVEGGAYYALGVWRSEQTNCMINNIKYYSVACREQIVKRILTISGEGYTLEKFFENDWVRAPGAAAEMETKTFDPKSFIPLAPPVVIR